MIENISFTIKTVELNDSKSHGKFECEPLQKGFGITLGNSLRRVLLSSLDGVAITSIKIDGVLHEFSTIDGVREDVTDMILNLKKIRFRAYEEAEFPIRVRIDIDKEGVFHAGDIRLPSEIDILNGELELCTLEADTHLGMELIIDRGQGYVPFTKNKNADDIIGVIPIDSIYTPVIKCNYEVSDTRIGNEMDYDKLTLELETDGSIGVEDAVATAADILINSFAPFRALATTRTLSDDNGDVSGQNNEGKEESQELNLADVPVDELELGMRAFNCLKRSEINTVQDLIEHSESELNLIRNLGKQSIEEIKTRLYEFRNLGFKLKE